MYGKIYQVRSFYMALHIILTRFLPPDKDLRIYLRFFLIFSSLFRRLVGSHITFDRTIKPPARISLLVVIQPDPNFLSFHSHATIGFSATEYDTELGRKGLLYEMIKERTRNLPEIGGVRAKPDSPPPGQLC